MKNKKHTQTFLFTNREKDLTRIKRYSRFPVMYYRTNLSVHCKRVAAMVRLLSSFATARIKNFDADLAEAISKYHDDYEMVDFLGDVQLNDKLQMSKKQHKQLKQKEMKAIDVISIQYPKYVYLGDKKYRYKSLLIKAVSKNCPEAQLHSFADKLDGLNEGIHEVLAGNLGFLEAVLNYYGKTFNDCKKNFPLIAPLFCEELKQEFFNMPVINSLHYFSNGHSKASLHTEHSLNSNTGISYYDEWKKLTLTVFPNGKELLVKQLESHAH